MERVVWWGVRPEILTRLRETAPQMTLGGLLGGKI